MSKLESLVPPLELCKLIPAGEFGDSAFIWDKTTSIGFWDGEDKDGNHIGGFGKIPHLKYRLRQNYSERTRTHLKDQNIELDVFPAPMLEEIMAELVNFSPYAIKICQSFNEWNIECCVTGEYKERYISSDSVRNIATAALKLWLKLKGVEA